MDLHVYLQGDLEFANATLMAIVRMFGNTSTYADIQRGAGALMFIMLFVSYFKFIMAPERSPYPFKEFFTGLVGFMLFLGPMSPQFTVHLQSSNAGTHDVRTISNVPMLAAVPAWAGSALIGGLRNIVAENFTMPGMSTTAPPDPLGSLMRLHSAPYTPQIDAMGDGDSSKNSLKRSLANYMQDCFVPHQMFGPASDTGVNSLDQTPIDEVIDKIAVDYTGYDTTLFLTGDTKGKVMNCKDAYNKIRAEVKSPQFEQLLENYHRARNVDSASINMAYRILNGGGALPNPYEVMSGRFVAYHAYQALSGNDNPWANKMVFEAMQKRVYEQGAERALFLNYMIPMMSVFEMFAFFIAPIMMILSVMGGLGFAMIGKYMYIILFINLWGFNKVFVDFFTYLAAQKAFANSMQPFTVGSTPGVLNEIEGFLGVASALTASIPMLSMFLLYGGVHSLMGVMSSVNPSGKGHVDGNNAAPTLASNWNSGTMQMGQHGAAYNAVSGQIEQNLKTSDSGRFSGLGITEQVSQTFDRARELATNKTETTKQAFAESSSELFNEIMSDKSVVQGAKTKTWGEMNDAERLVATKNAIEDHTKVQGEAAEMAALNMYLSGDGSLSFGMKGNQKASGPRENNDTSSWNGGFNAGLSGGAKLNWQDSATFGISDTEAEKIEKSLSDTHKNRHTRSDQSSFTDLNETGTSSSYTSALNKARTDMQEFTQAYNDSQRISEGASKMMKFSNTTELNNEALAGMVSEGAVRKLFDPEHGAFTQEQLAQLSDKAGVETQGLAEHYLKQGEQLTGRADQAGFGAMRAMIDDISQLSPSTLGEARSQSDMLSEVFGAMGTDIRNQYGDRQDIEQLVNPVERLTNATREQSGGMVAGADQEGFTGNNQANEADVRTVGFANASKAHTVKDALNDKKAELIERGVMDEEGKYVQGSISAADYARDASLTEMSERLKLAQDRVEQHELLSAAQSKLLGGIKNNDGSLTAAMLEFKGLSGENRFERFLASQAEQNGLSGAAIVAGAGMLSNANANDITSLVSKVAQGTASNDEFEQYAQMKSAFDFMIGTREGFDATRIGMSDEAQDTFFANASAFYNAYDKNVDNANVQAVDSLLDSPAQMDNAIDAAGLLSGQAPAGGLVNPGFMADAQLNMLGSSEQFATQFNKLKGDLNEDTGGYFGNMLQRMGLNLSELTSAEALFLDQAKTILNKNARLGGYDAEAAMQALTGIVTSSDKVQTRSDPHRGTAQIAVDQLERGDANNLAAAIAANPELSKLYNKLSEDSNKLEGVEKVSPLAQERMDNVFQAAEDSYQTYLTGVGGKGDMSDLQMARLYQAQQSGKLSTEQAPLVRQANTMLTEGEATGKYNRDEATAQLISGITGAKGEAWQSVEDITDSSDLGKAMAGNPQLKELVGKLLPSSGAPRVKETPDGQGGGLSASQAEWVTQASALMVKDTGTYDTKAAITELITGVSSGQLKSLEQIKDDSELGKALESNPQLKELVGPALSSPGKEGEVSEKKPGALSELVAQASELMAQDEGAYDANAATAELLTGVHTDQWQSLEQIKDDSELGKALKGNPQLKELIGQVLPSPEKLDGVSGEHGEKPRGLSELVAQASALMVQDTGTYDANAATAELLTGVHTDQWQSVADISHESELGKALKGNASLKELVAQALAPSDKQVDQALAPSGDQAGTLSASQVDRVTQASQLLGQGQASGQYNASAATEQLTQGIRTGQWQSVADISTESALGKALAGNTSLKEQVEQALAPSDKQAGTLSASQVDWVTQASQLLGQGQASGQYNASAATEQLTQGIRTGQWQSVADISHESELGKALAGNTSLKEQVEQALAPSDKQAGTLSASQVDRVTQASQLLGQGQASGQYNASAATEQLTQGIRTGQWQSVADISHESELGKALAGNTSLKEQVEQALAPSDKQAGTLSASQVDRVTQASQLLGQGQASGQYNASAATEQLTQGIRTGQWQSVADISHESELGKALAGNTSLKEQVEQALAPSDKQAGTLSASQVDWVTQASQLLGQGQASGQYNASAATEQLTQGIRTGQWQSVADISHESELGKALAGNTSLKEQVEQALAPSDKQAGTLSASQVDRVTQASQLLGQGQASGQYNASAATEQLTQGIRTGQWQSVADISTESELGKALAGNTSLKEQVEQALAPSDKQAGTLSASQVDWVTQASQLLGQGQASGQYNASAATEQLTQGIRTGQWQSVADISTESELGKALAGNTSLKEQVGQALSDKGPQSTVDKLSMEHTQSEKERSIAHEVISLGPGMSLETDKAAIDLTDGSRIEVKDVAELDLEALYEHLYEQFMLNGEMMRLESLTDDGKTGFYRNTQTEQLYALGAGSQMMMPVKQHQL